jgi:hypothetical protein
VRISIGKIAVNCGLTFFNRLKIAVMDNCPRHSTEYRRLNAVSSGALHGGRNVMLPHREDSPTPRPAPEGGEVLAAGRARGPDANPASNPKPLSVKAFSMPSRVRCAGLRPPLTAPNTPLWSRHSNRPCTKNGKSAACQLPLETTLDHIGRP